MIQQLRYLLFLVIASGFYMSCEKVVSADIHEADKAYVIEGIVTNTGRCSVLISTTTNFSDTNTFRGVSGATVQVTDNGGTAITLSEKSKGVYSSSAIKGVAGHTYTLSVSIKGATYTASSTMPKQVSFNAMTVTRETVSGKERYVTNVKYTDPPETGNYYNFIQYINQHQDAAIYINNDNLINDASISYPLTIPLSLDTDDNMIRKGDTISVEMQCIDPAVYKYWYSLSASASGSDVLATPSNPVSNISGGVLGYFSAHTSQTRRIIVK